MPVIPQPQIVSNLRVGQARIDPGAATAPARALEGLGRTTGIILKRQKESDDAAFVAENINALLRSESELLSDIETKGSNVDMSTLQEEFRKRAGSFADNAPSVEARNDLIAQSDNAFTRKFFPSYSRHQSNLNVQNRVRSFEKGIDDIQSEVIGGRTDVAEAFGRVESALVGLEETSGGVVDIEQARIKSFNEITTNALGGRIDRGEGQDVISEIKEGKWDEFTDSKTLARILNSAERDVKQRDSASNRKFSNDLNDYVSFLSSGKDDEASAAKFSPDNVSAVFGDKAPDVNELISDSRSFGQEMNKIKTASPEELNAIVESQRPTQAQEFTRESKQFNILNSAIKARNKAIADDPSSYVMENSSIAKKSATNFIKAFGSGDPKATSKAAKEYAAIQRSMQEDLGVHPNGVQILTKEFENVLARQLNDFSQGGEQVAIQISTLQKSFGSEWSTIQRQLQSNKKMGEGLRVMAGMDFSPEMIRLGEALSVPQKDYQDLIGTGNFKDIRDDTLEEMEDFQDTLRGQPGAEEVFIQHKTAIETLAMKYMADGTFSSSGDAIEQARTDVLDSRFTFVDSYRIPSNFSADDVEDNVDNAIDKIQEGFFNLFIPESDVVKNPEDRKEVYLSALRPKPITSPNGDGILFTDQNGNTIFLESGDPLIIPFTKLSRR
ncbi:MAG: hypothetical protein V3U78_04615 [Thiotrichaceae bacterium]